MSFMSRKDPVMTTSSSVSFESVPIVGLGDGIDGYGGGHYSRGSNSQEMFGPVSSGVLLVLRVARRDERMRAGQAEGESGRVNSASR